MNRLKELRTEKLLTQEDLAKLVGLSNVSIHKIETGKTKPHFSSIKKLAKALEVEPRELNF